MYYQEKIINGIICYKNTPNGEWIEMSKEHLTKRVQKLSLQHLEAKQKAECLEAEIEAWKELVQKFRR